MKAVHYSTLRNNLKSYINCVTDDYETLIITRKNGKNVVMMPLDEYNNLMENNHLLSNDLNRTALKESLQQLVQGLVVNKSLTDDNK